jgi:hypothetical protein
MSDDRNEFQRRIGVGERQHVYGRQAGKASVTPVVVEDGPRRGQVGGQHVDHWDGHRDATVFAPSVQLTATTKES